MRAQKKTKPVQKRTTPLHLVTIVNATQVIMSQFVSIHTSCATVSPCRPGGPRHPGTPSPPHTHTFRGPDKAQHDHSSKRCSGQTLGELTCRKEAFRNAWQTQSISMSTSACLDLVLHRKHDQMDKRQAWWPACTENKKDKKPQQSNSHSR